MAFTRDDAWPELPMASWNECSATVHMWTQIVGKIRLHESAPINHSWHSTLYVTSRGLTTSPIPHGMRTFQIDFDLIDHVLTIDASDGQKARLPLQPQTVSAFYSRLMDALDGHLEQLFEVDLALANPGPTGTIEVEIID